MPTSKSKDPEPRPQPDEAAAPAPDTSAATPAPAPAPKAEQAAPGPGVYEYTHYADSVYPHVPLTARAATPDRPATVYDWPFGPPEDGRWIPTSKKPNQAADNAPALPSKE